MDYIWIILLFIGLTPFVSTYATNNTHYQWDKPNISYMDYSSYFKNYEGSFVLYDLKKDLWTIHDFENATLQVSPNSTYKLYDALFGLEEHIITPNNSFFAWNETLYPFEAWNKDQTLQSAMQSSVNWYFQTIDEQLGKNRIQNYIKKIGYGNETISGDFSTYWLESSLKISAIEQVELLIKFYQNTLGFSLENTNIVKESLLLSTSENKTFYGKTGTGRIDGKDINGWFIGYVETLDNTYFFATNIRASSNATGSCAAELTMSVLSEMGI